jgi:hypothetical protein
MIPKSRCRFSEKIMLKQDAKAKYRINLKSFRFTVVAPAEQGIKGGGASIKDSIAAPLAPGVDSRNSRVRLVASPTHPAVCPQIWGGKCMHKSLVAAAATVAVLAIGGPANKAAAMLVVTPNELGLAGGAATVERTVLVCDAWRCYWRPGYWGWYRPYPYPYPYWDWRRHYWWGWHRA